MWSSWSLAFPLVFMFLLGVVFGDQGGVGAAKVGVADIDGTTYSKALTQAFSASGRLEIVTGDEATLTRRLKKGDLSALVVIPQGFRAGVGAATGSAGANGTGSPAGSTSTTTAPQPATLEVFFDPSSLVGSQVAMGTVSAVVEGFQQQLTRAPELIRIQSASVQRSDLSYRDFLIPGVLALALLTSGVIGIAPTWVQPVVRVIPVAYLANGLRDVMIRGYGLGVVWPDFAFLVGMAVVFGLLSIRVFRWQE